MKNDLETNQDTRHYLVTWCSEGLESVVPITDFEEQDVLTVLKGGKPEYRAAYILNMLTLRARFNPQRFYEIYSVNAVSGITGDDIKEMFEQSPQLAAETIRSCGKQLYSDRQHRKIIIS